MTNSYAIPVKGSKQYAFCDQADAELVQGFRWQLLTNGYIGAWRGKWLIYLHRLIAGAGPDELVDHANQDLFDNRTGNLRIANKKLNGANHLADRRRLGTTSRHKGVSWRKARNYWGAYIHIDGKTHYLGGFQEENDAARAYNTAALKAWGEFARLNEVEGAATAGDA